MYRDLTERRETGNALRRLAARLLARQDNERRGIAHALHDSTGQSFLHAEDLVRCIRNNGANKSTLLYRRFYR